MVYIRAEFNGNPFNGGDNFAEAIKEKTKESVDARKPELFRSWQEYPPELPNQRYVRTGRLGRALRVFVASGRKPDDVRVVALSAMPGARKNYTSVVKGRMTSKDSDVAGDTQARIHQGRWELAYVPLKTFSTGVISDVESAFPEIVEGNFSSFEFRRQ